MARPLRPYPAYLARKQAEQERKAMNRMNPPRYWQWSGMRNPYLQNLAPAHDKSLVQRWLETT